VSHQCPAKYIYDLGIFLYVCTLIISILQRERENERERERELKLLPMHRI
jgi:hypothetical protein